ncbi:MAG: hypothetical protein J6Q61_08405, partial [Bacteroidales bacterium]|nr:hypothetical protein [Bacteroidales bacterium]
IHIFIFRNLDDFMFKAKMRENYGIAETRCNPGNTLMIRNTDELVFRVSTTLLNLSAKFIILFQKSKCF